MPFFFVEAPARGLAIVVTVTLLEEEVAVDPRVDLVWRLVAMELVFSDMRERNNKRESSMKVVKSQQTTLQITARFRCLAKCRELKGGDLA
jgi:hypothetical protein